MIRLEWSVFAQADRDAIFDYIEIDSAEAAVNIDDRIETQIEELTRFPEMGRPGRIEGTRELIILRTPYIVAYQFRRRYDPDSACVAWRSTVA